MNMQINPLFGEVIFMLIDKVARKKDKDNN